MCIGCGLCESIAGRDTVRVTKVQSGYEAPVVVAEPAAALVDRIYAVCPGLRVDGLPNDEVDADTETDLVWGPTRRIVRAWAGDENVRYQGATGGVLTALAQFLLASDSVDAILHVRAGGAEPAFGQPTLSFTETEVHAAAGSRIPVGLGQRAVRESIARLCGLDPSTRPRPRADRHHLLLSAAGQ